MSNLAAVKEQVAAVKMTTVYDFMEHQRDLIARALPKTITSERLLGIFTMILKSSPQLTQCSQQSLIGAIVQTVQLGLTPGNVGHVHLVPFNNKRKDGSFVRDVQLIVGYKGLCELVNRSGKASILNAECVYEKDVFEYEQGLNPVLRHIPAQGERGAFIGVYCIAKNMLANEKVFVYLQKEEIEKVRRSSKAGSSDYSPWATWYEEMAKKTAVKRISKLLPLSVDVQQKISADETIKTKIDRDMTELPDETNWEDVEAHVETSPVKPGEPQQIEPKPGNHREAPSQENATEGKSAQNNHICWACEQVVSDKVAKFSQDKYKKVLCMDCQKEAK